MATNSDFKIRRASFRELLRKQFGNVQSVTIEQALSFIPGFSSSRGAARKRKERGTYPFPITRFCGQHFVLLDDIANTLAAAPVPGFISDAANDEAPANPAPPRGPGRPRKTLVVGGAE